VVGVGHIPSPNDSLRRPRGDLARLTRVAGVDAWFGGHSHNLIVGEVNGGWAVAQTTLMHERNLIGTGGIGIGFDDLLIATGSVLLLERRGTLEGFLFLRSLPARAIVGPAVATSEEALGILVDAASQSLAGRSAVMRASAASPAVLKRAFARGFRVDHLGNLMVVGDIVLPPAQLYALFPESL
jgi:hypothetical protein